MVTYKIIEEFSILRPKDNPEWRDKVIKARTLDEAYTFAENLGFSKEELEILSSKDLVKDMESGIIHEHVIEPSLKKYLEAKKKGDLTKSEVDTTRPEI